MSENTLIDTSLDIIKLPKKGVVMNLKNITKEELAEALLVAYQYLPAPEDVTEDHYAENYEQVLKENKLVRNAVKRIFPESLPNHGN